MKARIASVSFLVVFVFTNFNVFATETPANKEKISNAPPADSEIAISKSEWLHSFSENYASIFCEKLNEKKNCKQLVRSDCIKMSSESVAVCSKMQSLPEDIFPGLPSNQLGLKLGVCASRRLELSLIKKGVCKK
jgi:hypothetical protein